MAFVAGIWPTWLLVGDDDKALVAAKFRGEPGDQHRLERPPVGARHLINRQHITGVNRFATLGELLEIKAVACLAADVTSLVNAVAEVFKVEGDIKLAATASQVIPTPDDACVLGPFLDRFKKLREVVGTQLPP